MSRMLLTGESGSSGRETCLSANSSTKNLTWDDPGFNLDLRGEMLATKSSSHSTSTTAVLLCMHCTSGHIITSESYVSVEDHNHLHREAEVVLRS
jgi:hypothetical protein